MSTALKDLRELLAKATPLPWTGQCLGGRELGDAGLMANLESVSSPFSRSSHADDLAFAVAAINSLPALLEIAELAQGVCDHDPLLYDVRFCLREALNKLNNKAQGK